MKNAQISEIALSAAYMGMGFAKACEAKAAEISQVIAAKHWGQLELVGYLSEWAARLEQLYASLDQDTRDSSPGVWVYEVAEPFGEWFGLQVASGDIPEREAMDAELVASVAEFFTQCDEQKTANKAELMTVLRTNLRALS